MIGAIAMTEPGGGSDLQGIRTNAVRNRSQLFRSKIAPPGEDSPPVSEFLGSIK